jgi:hypothetical protein
MQCEWGRIHLSIICDNGRRPVFSNAVSYWNNGDNRQVQFRLMDRISSGWRLWSMVKNCVAISLILILMTSGVMAWTHGNASGGSFLLDNLSGNLTDASGNLLVQG